MSQTPSRIALFGDLLDLPQDPGFDIAPGSARYRPAHWIWIEGDAIVQVTPASQPPPESFERHDHSGHLILPGFIDTHVHSVQLDVIAAYGTELLDWLSTHTFPAELRQADPGYATATAERFTQALLAHGTTTAVVFPSVHKTSVDALFAAARARGMRLITGKCLMDRHAPQGLTDTVASGERDTRELVERWHGQGRLAYAHTVRFAPASTPEQLAMASRLLATMPGTYLQTHVAENLAEVAWARQLFPGSRSYLSVYGDAGLLGPRSLVAHGIWFDEADLALLARTATVVSHCPSSNLFLGSGLMNWQGIEAAGGRVTVASDVGGGTSLSMLRTLAAAYQVQALRGVKLPAFKAIYTATQGAAQALGLAHEIGTIEPGRVADLAVWRWAVGPVALHRDQLIAQRPLRSDHERLHDRLFAWLTLGDERNLVATWVAGERRHATEA